MICLIVFVPALAYCHPGKVDRRGGHTCRKDCSEWDLYSGEYHLHEDYYRPVKLPEKDEPRQSPVQDSLPGEAMQAGIETPPAPEEPLPRKTEDVKHVPPAPIKIPAAPPPGDLAMNTGMLMAASLCVAILCLLLLYLRRRRCR